MTSIAPGSHDRKVVVGVDTHKYVHVTVALEARLAEQHVPANREGYARLEAWGASLAYPQCSVSKARAVTAPGLPGSCAAWGYRVVEVNRGDRRSAAPTARATP